MTNKPISEVIAVLAQAVAETDGSEWQTESGSVITEDYTANGYTVTDHICDCEVINGDSPVATFIAAANPVNVKRLIDHIAAIEQQLAAERARVVKLPDIRIVRVAGHEIEMYHAATLREYLRWSGIPVEGE